mmetsp:Transcript_11830/g.41428  ORF Transcript_11830/g.41428 Transcript_11830/m.41428 type:complete len:283 (+) Transcript_11830:2260-3108(+)
MQVLLHPVQVEEPVQHLLHEGLDVQHRQLHLVRVAQPRHVVVGVLEDHERGALRVLLRRTRGHDLDQVHDVGVVQARQDVDLAQRSNGEPVHLLVGLDALQRAHLPRRLVAREQHLAVRALTDLLAHLVVADVAAPLAPPREAPAAAAPFRRRRAATGRAATTGTRTSLRCCLSRLRSTASTPSSHPRAGRADLCLHRDVPARGSVRATGRAVTTTLRITCSHAQLRPRRRRVRERLGRRRPTALRRRQSALVGQIAIRTPLRGRHRCQGRLHHPRYRLPHY